jgi:hypothetical protein
MLLKLNYESLPIARNVFKPFFFPTVVRRRQIRNTINIAVIDGQGYRWIIIGRQPALFCHPIMQVLHSLHWKKPELPHRELSTEFQRN